MSSRPHTPIVERMTHLSDAEIIAYLEGTLPWREHAEVRRHLDECPDCLHRVAQAAASLSEADLLPPPRYYHPIEYLLLRLQRWLPLPILSLHALLVTLAYVLWALCVGVAGPAIPWHGSARLVLSIWPVILGTTLHLLWLQPHLRNLVEASWRAGADRPALQRLQSRIAWLQGWPLGGIWLFVGLDVLMNVSNWLASRPITWQHPLETGVGVYEGLAFVALVWGTLCGGAVLRAIARLLDTQPDEAVLSVVAGARRRGVGWVAIVSIGAAIYLRISATYIVTPVLWYGWALIVTLILLFLWSGYATLELSFSQTMPDRNGRLMYQARHILTLLLPFTPLLVSLISRHPFHFII